MFETNSPVWLFSILIATQNLGLSRGILMEKWIEQRQDHFDSFNDKTWFMRYYENDEFYHQSGRIFIMIGGEFALTPDIIEVDYMMYRMAETYQAMMYSIEHRYYGKSHPVPDTSFENLRYLSIPQVLADIAFFIETKKREFNNPNAFTMLFGCSYAGNLAAWMRVAYPNLVQGALASSAPIYIKANFFEFFLHVENSIHEYDENCATNIKAAISALEEFLDGPAINSIKVKNDFNLCSPVFFQPADISFMMYALAKTISAIVLRNRIDVNGKTSIQNLCIAMRGDETIPSYYKLAEVFKGFNSRNNSCISLKYSDSIIQFLDTSWESAMVRDRVWSYQTCTKLGYFMTLLSPASIFGSRVPLQYFVDLCGDIFGAGFSLHYLDYNIRAMDHFYNSKLSTTTNIMFMNGDLDPWRSLSVLSDLNNDSPAILINGATHCESVKRGAVSEKKSIIAGRCQASLIISEWLHEWLRFH